MKKEVILSGSGGQGLILAGIILSEGAILSNLEVVQTQSYGPEARGGASKSEVIISDTEINFPKVKKADLLLCLTQKSFEEYANITNKNAIIIVDSLIKINISLDESIQIIKVPIIETSKNKLKKEMVANIVSLGVISNILNFIDEDKLKQVILNRVPRGTEKLNEEAFKLGKTLISYVY